MGFLEPGCPGNLKSRGRDDLFTFMLGLRSACPSARYSSGTGRSFAGDDFIGGLLISLAFSAGAFPDPGSPARRLS